MKKALIHGTAAAALCVIALSCRLDNLVDREKAEAMYASPFIQEHAELKKEVLDIVNTAAKTMSDSVVSGLTSANLRPDRTNSHNGVQIPSTFPGQSGTANTNPTACCWAHKTRASLHPFDDTNGWTNTYDDAIPRNAVDGGQGSTADPWWNMNYSRPAASYPNKKHTEVPSSDGGNHWWEVDLGENKNIDGISYWGRRSQSNSRIKEYEVYVSPNPLNHTPAPQYLAASGTFLDNNAQQDIRFLLVYGRYLQIRVISSVNDNGNDGGIGEMRVRLYNPSGNPDLSISVKDAVTAAFAAYGLKIDYSWLKAAYAEGVPLLGTLKGRPAYDELNELLNGSGVFKGAAQYLDPGDPDRPSEAVASSAEAAAFFAYQDKIDALTSKILIKMQSLASK